MKTLRWQLKDYFKEYEPTKNLPIVDNVVIIHDVIEMVSEELLRKLTAELHTIDIDILPENVREVIAEMNKRIVREL